MIPGMKFYIASIVSIFIALGIGMYIGFSMDTHEFVLDQKENLISILELEFENLTKKNTEIKEENEELKMNKNHQNEYIRSSYDFIVKDRLTDLRIGIIESNSDYVTSSIGKDLELAGGKVVNLTTLNKSIMEKENLDYLLKSIVESMVYGEESKEILELKKENHIDFIGSYSEAIDYLVISGGAFDQSLDRINKIDRLIVDLGRKHNIPIIGVEKSNVIYSYMEAYKELDIATIDNVDMIIGKVAMILAMEGRTGNYGIKSSAKSILPFDINPILE